MQSNFARENYYMYLSILKSSKEKFKTFYRCCTHNCCIYVIHVNIVKMKSNCSDVPPILVLRNRSLPYLSILGLMS